MDSHRSTMLFEQALLSLDRLAARQVLEDALVDETVSSKTLEQVVVPALERIGRGWEDGHVALAQVYLSGRICEELVDILLPAASENRAFLPKMAICLLEDQHQLGKRIVYSVLRASGFVIEDYGRLTTADLVRRAIHDQVSVLLISTLTLPSALRVREVRDGLRAAQLDTKIVVGGAPFRLDPDLYREVGADAMGATASDAVGIVTQLLAGAP